MLCQGPGDILTHSWGRIETAGGAFEASLVKDSGVHVTVVEIDHIGALVGPNLSYFCQLLIPTVKLKGVFRER